MTGAQRLAVWTLASGSFVAALGALWTTAASWLFVWMGGLFQAFPWPWSTWWLYVQSQPLDRWTKVYLAASGAFASVPVVLIVVVTGYVVWPARKLRRPLMGDLRPIERGV